MRRRPFRAQFRHGSDNLCEEHRRLNSSSGSQGIICPPKPEMLFLGLILRSSPFWPSLWSHGHHYAIVYGSCKSVPTQWEAALHKDINTRRWRTMETLRLGTLLGTGHHKGVNLDWLTQSLNLLDSSVQVGKSPGYKQLCRLCKNTQNNLFFCLSLKN